MSVYRTIGPLVLFSGSKIILSHFSKIETKINILLDPNELCYYLGRMTAFDIISSHSLIPFTF